MKDDKNVHRWSAAVRIALGATMIVSCRATPHQGVSEMPAEAATKPARPTNSIDAMQPDETVLEAKTPDEEVPPKPADQASYGKYSLEIYELESSCTLEVASGDDSPQRYELELPPPCRFIRRNEKLQHFSYPKDNVNAVVLISGYPPSEEIKKSYRLERFGDKSNECGDRVRGIVFTDHAELSPKIASILICPHLGADERVFAEFVRDGDR